MDTVNLGFPGRCDSTYFRAADCEPEIKGDAVVYHDGRGSLRRSWGSPQITTTIIVDDCDFLALHVGFSHKHRGGQFWRYYIRTENGDIERRLWQQLTDDERQIVFDALDNAPRWAKSPGKLRANYKLPVIAQETGYKIVRVTDGGLTSLYDDTPWTLGKRNGERAREDHRGGYYVHPNPERLKKLWNEGELVVSRLKTPGSYALVECLCSGTCIGYSSGKCAYTYVTPVKILEQWME